MEWPAKPAPGHVEVSAMHACTARGATDVVIRDRSPNPPPPSATPDAGDESLVTRLQEQLAEQRRLLDLASEEVDRRVFLAKHHGDGPPERDWGAARAEMRRLQDKVAGIAAALEEAVAGERSADLET